MFEHKKINTLNDFFIELHKRPEEGIYFYRLMAIQKKLKLLFKITTNPQEEPEL